ncbi:hypothetical protein GLAREA_02183 [Glarea lozoyensis ATCC 20868]|uniref:Uncharacterized protein n=1 Tax=Glarea lozoyensis (strain ATCC 20868 / MF5171) TaxID=1116229 RepID=S3D2M7_GLAL2|nr:uncharacterized protein GLAREA_02183 [Glarea lozoyensis ATCC 20868]EPE26271.1 hypothetical protein GLAREA_02183 [Glarea lozoyensis ATCC 20868]
MANIITQDNLDAFLDPNWEDESSNPPTSPPPREAIVQAPKSEMMVSRKTTEKPLPPFLTPGASPSSSSSQLPSSHASSLMNPNSPPINHPHSLILSTSTHPGSLRDYLINHGALTLEQIMQLTAEKFPVMSEKDVVRVMNTDIARGYLKSVYLNGRGMGWGRFLWVWV